MIEMQSQTLETPKIPQTIQLVELKNGTRAPKALVKNVMIKILELNKSSGHGALVLVELVMIARGPSDLVFETCRERLRGLDLLESDNSITDDVRNIVLSCAIGEGANLHFVSPYKE